MPSSPATEPEPEPAVETDGGVEAEVAELRARVGELDDLRRRALADLDNFRKRSARLVESRVEEAGDAIVRDWLEAVDSVERALRMEPEHPDAEGVRGVLGQMEAILERQGVRRVAARGEPFDPLRHEAVAVRPAGEVPEHTVADVARSGWTRGDRLLRPAQVVVARGAG